MEAIQIFTALAILNLSAFVVALIEPAYGWDNLWLLIGIGEFVLSVWGLIKLNK